METLINDEMLCEPSRLELEQRKLQQLEHDLATCEPDDFAMLRREVFRQAEIVEELERK